MQRGFGSGRDAIEQAAGFQQDLANEAEGIDDSLGASVAPTDRDRLAYMADLISEFQTMAIDMRLGMLARILSVAVAETSRLLETPDAAASPARNRR